MTSLLTPQLLLSAYAQGYFPMARTRESTEVFWCNPEERGIIPLDEFHVPRSLTKFLKKQPFEIRINTAFTEVIQNCAAARKSTWINDEIIAAYCELHRLGHAHSIECWSPPPTREGSGGFAASAESERNEPKSILVGGLYGIALGGAFFGESMFSHESNASKAALVHLVARLRAAGFLLLDAQFENAHLKQFGAITIPRVRYLELLENALNASDNPSMRFLTASPARS